jgi:hypothetical protein
MTAWSSGGPSADTSMCSCSDRNDAMPRRRAPPPTSSARVTVTPVLARQATSVWRRSRASGPSSGASASWMRAHASLWAGSAVEAMKPSVCLACSACWIGRRHVRAMASVRWRPPRASVRT